MELYKYKFIKGFSPGYIVYRECFDTDKCSIESGVIEHRVALFTTMIEAENYCKYRNYMMQKYGHDGVEKIVDFDV